MFEARFGFDVAAVRADDLDKLLLEFVSTHKNLKVLDLGCGSGGQSFRLASAGALVTGVDIEDYSKNFSEYCLNNNLNKEQLSFIKGDIRELTKILNSQKFSIACVQRVIHYLTYCEAREFLCELQKYVTDGLYISVSGLDSAIGEDYQAREVNVKKRFARLNQINADNFYIHEPVCLYTKVEFENLLKDAGWPVKKIWQSAFGNIKVICTNS
ncbi:class I SAM-dependent methyltransferase [Candidatus Kaiserbacteria bacterium]|nr:class I SAM-dependent methyltransferase [Candidatus Kaiserbacteria bacterium]